MSKYDREPEVFTISGERVELIDCDHIHDLEFKVITRNDHLRAQILAKLVKIGQVEYGLGRDNLGRSILHVNNDEDFLREHDLVDPNDTRQMVTVSDARTLLEKLTQDKEIDAQMRSARAEESHKLGPSNYKLGRRDSSRER